MNAAAGNAQGGRPPEGTAQAGPTPLEVLAQAIANLSADDRAKLAAVLAQETTAKDAGR